MDPEAIAKAIEKSIRIDRQKLYREALLYCKTAADFASVESMDDWALTVFVHHYRDLLRQSRGEPRQGRWVKIELSYDPAKVWHRTPEKAQPGKPAAKDYDWAYEQLEDGRSFGDIFAEWSETPHAHDLTDPRKSLKNAIDSRRRKKR